MNTVDTTVTLGGKFLTLPVFSHVDHGKTYHKATVAVTRPSGYIDRVPLLLTGDLVTLVDTSGLYKVTGDLRSYRLYGEDGLKHLYHKVVAYNILPSSNFVNETSLSGIVTKVSPIRKTYYGKTIINVTLKVPSYRFFIIPCIAWGSTAHQFNDTIRIGAQVSCFGRLQSRIHQTSSGCREIVEFSINSVT